MNSQYILDEMKEVYSLMDRLCETTLLLEDTLEQVYAKHYSEGKPKHIPEDVFYQIVPIDPKTNLEKNKKGNFCPWLIDLYRAGGLNLDNNEELANITKYLEIAYKLKNNGFDINQYHSVEELHNAVEPYMNGKATSKSEEIKRIKERGAELVYEDNDWIVITPKTKEAAIYYGKGTTWCTAATTSENYFDSYNESGPLYININKHTKEKYQFHLVKSEFKNELNLNVNNDTVQLSDKLIDFYILKGRLGFYPFLNDFQRIVNACKQHGIDPVKDAIEKGQREAIKLFAKGDFVIPDGIEKIGNYAFEDCKELTSVVMPDSVTETGWDIFSRCPALKSVVMSDSLTDIKGSLFYKCVNLTSVKLPKNLKIIGWNAFAFCESLNEIDIPETVEYIDNGAFMDSGLTSFNLPENIKTIGKNAFLGTPWLDNNPDGVIYLGKIAYTYKGDMPEGASITIKDGCELVYADVFNGRTELASVTIPNSVKQLGYGCFEGCTGLTSVTLSESLSCITCDCFKGCTSLKTVTIPSTIHAIFDECFSGCTNLTTIVIPRYFSYFGDNVFDNCPNLTIYVYYSNHYDELKKMGYNNVVLLDDDNNPIQRESKYHGIMMEVLDEILRNYG